MPESQSPTNRDIHTLVNDTLAADAERRVQALRQLNKRLAEHYNIENLPDSTRVILARSISSYSISSKLASQCLLRIISNSSASVLNQQCQSIMHPIISAFMSATRALQCFKRKDLLVKTTYLMRILSTMISKLGSSALVSLSDQIDCIQRCYQPIPSVQPCQPPERVVFSSQPTPKRTPRLPHAYSDSEISSEGEGNILSDATPQAVQCRLDAMNCLRTMAEADPKALYSLWPRLLPACEYRNHHPHTLMNVIERDCQLAVRLRACSVLQKLLEGSGSYMAIAEENNSRVSFISLSAQLASITIELHRRLGCLLKAPPIASELTKEVLKVCETLCSVSAYHRISTSILDYILNPIVGLLESINIEIKNQAIISLAVIFQHLSSTSKTINSQIRPLLDKCTSIACHNLLCNSNEDFIPSWCDLLRSTLPLLDWNSHLIERFSKLQAIFQTIPVNEEEAGKKLSLLGSLTMFFPEETFDAIYIVWVRDRLRGDGLDSLDMVVNGKCQRILTYITKNLELDVQNSWDDVRAIRLIGIIVSKSSIHRPTELATKVAIYLTNHYDQVATEILDEKVLSTHTWVMANCMELMKDSDNEQSCNVPPLDVGFWMKVLKIMQRLLANGSPSNSLKTNSVRISGVALIKLLSMHVLRVVEFQSTINRALKQFFEFLDLALPKVQWNVATVLRQILSVLTVVRSSLYGFDVQEEEEIMMIIMKDEIVEELSKCLEISRSFKVRIQVCLALEVVNRRKLSDKILQSIIKIKERLDEQMSNREIPNKEMEHAKRLQLEIEKLLYDGHETLQLGEHT